MVIKDTEERETEQQSNSRKDKNRNHNMEYFVKMFLERSEKNNIESLPSLKMQLVNKCKVKKNDFNYLDLCLFND